MKRLNEKEGRPFKYGDIGEDGRFFIGYANTKNTQGYFYEDWRTLESIEADKKRRKKKYDDRRKYLNAIKLESGCVCCGYKEHAEGLEFDHINPEEKTCNISKNNLSEARLKAELEKCQVLCGTCHNIKTFAPEKWNILLRSA